GAQAGQGFKLQQPDKASVTVGDTLTLTCTTSGGGSPGAVKWLKGGSGGNETVYDQKGTFPRVTRVVDGSNTDFSIRIRDIHPEDAGTYYCVKFIKLLGSDDKVLQRGKGTEVSVHETSPVHSIVAAAVVLCFLLLLGLFIALCMYRRKRRGDAGSLAGLAATGSFSPIPLQCCAGTPGTPRYFSCDSVHHLCALLQQSSKGDNDIHYADLKPLPATSWHGKSPGAACSEYASVRVAAK
ncbi:SIRBL protein, partial [Cochlearius cochlearius]|nr:SIRBL protein [Cochlearius cochlearius]